MLHGTPVDEEYPEWFFHTLDWTEGCIALTNSDMREIWGLVKDGTLIEIRPKPGSACRPCQQAIESELHVR